MKDQKTLIDILMRHAPESGSFHTKIADFWITRRDTSHMPEHIQYLAPLLIREIHYRLLTSPQGRHVKAINMFGNPPLKDIRAILSLAS